MADTIQTLADYAALERRAASEAKSSASKPRPKSTPEQTFTESELSERLAPKKNESDYHPLEFADPVEMLHFFVPQIASGDITLHPWQVETQLFVSQPGFTKQNPLRFILCACNGSGKDAYLNAPFAIWFALTKVRSRVIITSSSYTQLKSQTEAYIRNLAFTINRWFAEKFGGEDDLFTIRKEHLVCNATGSEIKLFVTDDPGKAEGFHPFPDHPKAELAIIINEAKSVPEDIFGALSRCTYTHWLEVSSPGKTSGHLYKLYCRSNSWDNGYEPGKPISRKVTVFDCPHIPPSRIEEDKLDLGEFSALFRSKNLAEFTSVDENVVIDAESLDKCLESAMRHIVPKHAKIRVGIDLAAGGDENAVVIFLGNKYHEGHFWRTKDTSLTAAKIVEILNSYKRTHGLTEDNCFGDDGGVGRSTLDKVRDLGWSVNRVLNQTRALNTQRYANRGAELWFTIKRLVEERLILLPKGDTTLRNQLTNRYFSQSNTNGKILLESKTEARAKGRPSPDRADAVALAFTGLTIHDFLDNISPTQEIPNGKKRKVIGNTGDDLEQFMDDLTFKQTKDVKAGERIHNSLDAAISTLEEDTTYGKWN